MAITESVASAPRAARNGRSAGRPRSSDLTSLPATVDWLRNQVLLLETDVEIDPDLELTGIQKGFDGSYPILFNTVKGYPHVRAVTNLFANYGVIERMFGWDNATDRTRKLAYALTHPIKPVEIAQREAACQQEVLTDLADLDVGKIIMAIRHTAQESELTVGSGNSVVAGDYFAGGSHIGYNR